MNVLVMKENNTLLVKEQGSDWVRGEIAFIGEAENGEYVFTPRPNAVFRSGDLVDIARQVGFLNLETINPTQQGFFSPSEDSALRTASETAGADTLAGAAVDTTAGAVATAAAAGTVATAAAGTVATAVAGTVAITTISSLD